MASIVLLAIYGKSITSMDDEYVVTAQKASEGFGLALIPGAYWVEFLPFLRHIPSWVPGTTARKLADEYMPYVSYVRNKPYDETTEAFVSTQSH